VNAFSVDASNPTSTKVNYYGNPSYAVIPSVNFTAPGTTQQASNVSGSFYFTYNQADAGWGANPINLQYFSSGSEVFNVTKSEKNPDAMEVLSAYFLAEGVGLRVYNHKLREGYDPHVYSCTYSGKTIYTMSSHTLMYFNQDYDDIAGWTERHKYSWNGGSSNWVSMSVSSGWLPAYTAGRNCNTNIWCIPTSLKGISDCTGLMWDTGNGYVMGVITNSEVDVSMPE